MKIRILAISFIAIISLVACSSGATTKPITKVPQTIGKTEGALSLIAPSGYVENGSNDPRIDWVNNFEKTTHCKVSVTIEDDNDTLIKKVRSGNYDGIVGDAQVSGELLASRDIDPINQNLIASYGNISDFIKNKSWNSIDNTPYGIPISIRFFSFAYDSDIIKTTPTSWSDFYSPKSKEFNQLAIPDTPFMIAQTALYLRNNNNKSNKKSDKKTDSTITNPFALDSKQLQQVISILGIQDKKVDNYWTNNLDARNTFIEGSPAGILPLSVVYALNNNNIAATPTIPHEGILGFSDTWMISSKAPHPNCMYAWFNHVSSPEVNAQFAQYMGLAPANAEACSKTSDPSFCNLYHAQDSDFLSKVTFATLPQTTCLDGRKNIKCSNFHTWQTQWNKIAHPDTK